MAALRAMAVSVADPAGAFVDTLVSKLSEAKRDRLRVVAQMVQDELGDDQPQAMGERDVEAWVRDVMDDHDERKGPLYARLMANALRGRIPPAFDLPLLLRGLRQCTWEELVVLSYVGVAAPDKSPTDYQEVSVRGDSPLARFLYCARRLEVEDWISIPDKATLGPKQFVPGEATLQGVGQCLHEMCGLESLRDDPVFADVSYCFSATCRNSLNRIAP